MWSLPTHAGRMRVCEMRACAGWLGASSKLLHYQNPVEVNDSLNAFADGFLTALAPRGLGRGCRARQLPVKGALGALCPSFNKGLDVP